MGIGSFLNGVGKAATAPFNLAGQALYGLDLAMQGTTPERERQVVEENRRMRRMQEIRDLLNTPAGRKMAAETMGTGYSPQDFETPITSHQQAVLDSQRRAQDLQALAGQVDALSSQQKVWADSIPPTGSSPEEEKAYNQEGRKIMAELSRVNAEMEKLRQGGGALSDISKGQAPSSPPPADAAAPSSASAPQDTSFWGTVRDSMKSFKPLPSSQGTPQPRTMAMDMARSGQQRAQQAAEEDRRHAEEAVRTSAAVGPAASRARSKAGWADSFRRTGEALGRTTPTGSIHSGALSQVARSQPQQAPAGPQLRMPTTGDLIASPVSSALSGMSPYGLRINPAVTANPTIPWLRSDAPSAMTKKIQEYLQQGLLTEDEIRSADDVKPYLMR